LNDETNDTSGMLTANESVSFVNPKLKSHKSSLKKALFESDDSNLTLNHSDMEKKPQQNRVKVVKEARRRNMVEFEEIEEEGEELDPDEEELEEEGEDEEDVEEMEENGMDESSDYYTVYKHQKEKRNQKTISSTPNRDR
jgi:hypothetical protein